MNNVSSVDVFVNIPNHLVKHKLWKVLRCRVPAYAEQMFFLRCMKDASYDIEEIFNIVNLNNCWKGYNKKQALLFIKRFFNGGV